MNSEVQLLGITYSEFDNKVGPQLKYAYPVDVLSKEAFEAYSDYVIVSKQLCEKLIVVAFDDVQFLNYSVAIDNVKYHRNALLFAFGFVLAKGVDIEPYGAVLEKIASTFVNLEIESEFLFQPSSRNRIQDFLRVLFYQLNEKNEAFMDLGFNNSYLTVKLFRKPVKPVDICDWDVPIFRRDRIDLSYLPWDISYQHLIPHIDGISHVKKIVYEVGMDIDSVRRSLKLLLFHGAILITDVFKFTNIYKVNTEEAISLLSNPTLMFEMRTFSAFVGKGSAHLPTANQIISFLLLLQPNKTIQQILLDELTSLTSSTTKKDEIDAERGSAEAKGVSDAVPSATQPLDLKNLDISRLIAFAKAHGMIRRVHEYPVFVPPPSSSGHAHALHAGTRAASQTSTVSQASSSDKLLGLSVHHPSAVSLDSNPLSHSLSHSQSHSTHSHTNSQTSSGRPLLDPNSPFSNYSHSNASTMSSSYTRSSNLPMPQHFQQNNSYSNNNNNNNNPNEASSVGLSGVLSTGTSLNVNPSNINKEIGMRKTSFGPAGGGAQDRAVQEALSLVQAQQQAALQNQTSASSTQYGQSYQQYQPSQGNSILRSPRFSLSNNNAQQQNNVNQSSAATHVVPSASSHIPAGVTSTTSTSSASGMSSNDLMSVASSPAPAPGTAVHRPSLSRYASRSKMTAGQNFLQNNHIHGGVSALNNHAASGVPLPIQRIEVRDILHRLTGKECMDAVCCRYDLTYQEIVNYPGVQLIYK